MSKRQRRPESGGDRGKRGWGDGYLYMKKFSIRCQNDEKGSDLSAFIDSHTEETNDVPESRRCFGISPSHR